MLATLELVTPVLIALGLAALGLAGASPPARAQTLAGAIALSPDAARVATFEAVPARRAGAGTASGAAPLPAPASPPAMQVLVRDVAEGTVVDTLPLCATCIGAGLAFAPDGKALAVLAHDTRTRTTSVVLREGAATRSLATISGTAATPRWSPDGRRLALLATIFPRKEPGAAQPGAPLTGEIGTRTDVQRIAVVALQDSLTRLVSPPGLYVYDYDWQRDGTGFVATAVEGNGDADWWRARLVAIAQADGSLRTIAAPPMQIAAPVALADGGTIAFLAGLMSDRAAISGDVYAVPLAGGAPVNLTPGFEGSFTSLARQGSGLVATAITGLASAIVPLDPARPGVPAPAWTTPLAIDAPGAAFDAAGLHVALMAQGYDMPPALRVGPVAGPPVLALSVPASSVPASPGPGTGFRQNGQGEAGLSGVRTVEWSRGGQRLQGTLLLPAGPSRGLVLEAHGGPVVASLPDWTGDDLRGDLLRAGYALFLPNPRGSAGRGEAFKALVRRDFGGNDLDDILAGLDTVLGLTGIARGRVGFLGLSYGGYLGLRANGRTGAFRAIVAGGAIADWQSYYGQNGIAGWMLPFFGASAYDDPAAYAAASPIGEIRKARTPTFIFVGERDIETPPAQSLQYWNALRAFDVPATLVIYPGEGHAIAGASSLADLRQRIVAWFDRWITP